MALVLISMATLGTAADKEKDKDKDKEKDKAKKAEPAPKAQPKSEPKPETGGRVRPTGTAASGPAGRTRSDGAAPSEYPGRPKTIPTGQAARPGPPGSGNPTGDRMGSRKPGMQAPPPPGTKVMIKGTGRGPDHQLQVTRTGAEVRRDRSGKVLEVHTPNGAVVRHTPGGVRQLEIKRPDGRTIVAHGNGRQGYIQRPFESGGKRFVSRTYVRGGVTHTRAYQPWTRGGRQYHIYAHNRFYRPAFYSWAYAPYRHPYAYAWGWEGRPWYGYYGGYFSPYPTYASPMFWLTDFMIAASLESAYLAREANESAPGYALAPPSAPSPGAAPAMSPEVKEYIAAEVRRMMDERQAEQATAQGNDSAAPTPSLFTDKGPRVFLVSEGLMDSSENKECSVGAGSVLQLLAPPPNPADEYVEVKVLVAHRTASCPQGSIISVRVDQLQEFHNQMMVTFDEGLEQLHRQGEEAAKPAPKGKPKEKDPFPVPPVKVRGTEDAPYLGDAPSGADAAEEFTRAVQETETDEQFAIDLAAREEREAAEAVVVARAKAVASIRPGMGMAAVLALLGEPSRREATWGGLRQIFIYEDATISFLAGISKDITIFVKQAPKPAAAPPPDNN